MNEDQQLWREYVKMAHAGVNDFVESMIICFIIFTIFAVLGIVTNVELYIEIIWKVAYLVLSTSYGLRVCKIVRKKIYTIAIITLVIVSIFVTTASIWITILCCFK